MAIIQALEFSVPMPQFLFCKKHKIITRIMDCSLHCAWTHGKGSAVLERRKPDVLNVQCQGLDSLRQ